MKKNYNWIDEIKYGWWIHAFINENKDGQNAPLRERGRIYYCSKCDRVYEYISTKRTEYFTREDLAYIGFPDKICRGCK